MKVGLITINDNNNYGNRLQNYATQVFLKSKNIEVETIKNDIIVKEKINYTLKDIPKRIIREIIHVLIEKKNIKRRKKKFEQFTNKYIKTTDFIITPNNIKENLNSEYDFFLVGSDQVWNPRWRLTNIDLLTFVEKNKRIAFAASIGAEDIAENKKEEFSIELKKFKSISVRENRAKEIIEELTDRKDVQVLVDPTMLLTNEQWDKIIKKPEQLKEEKYILIYFLGGISKERKKEIKRIAKINGCKIVNIINPRNNYYAIDPSEFLYLEKNAFLICTDSFHSCIFSILFNRPFVVFDREGKANNMMSRINNLIEKFKLRDRKFTGKITEKNLKHDYTLAYQILEEERKKTIEFIKKALELDNN